MKKMFDTSMFDLAPVARKEATVRGEDFRFTVLTPRLFRIEFQKDGAFEDRATKLVFRREFPVPAFTVEDGEELVIRTEEAELRYNRKAGTPSCARIFLKYPVRHKIACWEYGMEPLTAFNAPSNKGGTVSTLDNKDGEIPLEPGLVDIHGFTVLDDSRTMTLDEDGWFRPLEGDRVDLYVFCYSNEAVKTVENFARLGGGIPMIPRWALGNWWCRYWKYTEKSYAELMENFAKRNIPLSVAVIDMDWHLVSLPREYGDGWTGYTWNRDFFPDPPRFLRSLHDRGLKTALNLHPSSGIRPFEDCYERTARALGLDPAKKETVQFDASDPAFFRAYFDQVLHPLEEEGVDFWWLDWQQKGGASRPGYDPLWMLNHYFYADNARKGGYPVTFSRYGGLGSHRYPLGFSGDCAMTWESLDFQPYFTVTASNVAYGWWSHDIGGHWRGVWSDELQIRWLQFGVFSPILRPHSTNNPLLLKEPWSFPKETEEKMADLFRLRHRLVPYLYTMAYRAHKECRSLMEPLYYKVEPWPKNFPPEKKIRNEYTFGTELLVCPITSPVDPETQSGSVEAYLPAGVWIDFFNHRVYRGDRSLTLHRGLAEYPVLAKAGAILPLDGEPKNGVALPEKMDVAVFCGADGAFTLYEDNGEPVGNRAAFTPFSFTWGEKAVFTVSPVEGDRGATLPKRTYRLTFAACEKPESVTVLVNGAAKETAWRYDEASHTLSLAEVTLFAGDRLDVTFTSSGRLYANDFKAEIIARLARYQASNEWKTEVYNLICRCDDRMTLLSEIAAVTENRAVMGEIYEIVTAGE
ncbi:MAG: DUF5110 domain-containing protein [Clostridia bacterium]|nr:DUF5110 domain-containing protein [Clostridia bacterium]